MARIGRSIPNVTFTAKGFNEGIAAADGDADGIGGALADGITIIAADTVVAAGVGGSTVVGAQIATPDTVVAAGVGGSSVVGDALVIVAGVGATTSAYNPDDKAASITLSNDCLTATKTGATSYAVVRSFESHDSGKRYFEVRVDSVTDTAELGAIGLITSTGDLSDYLGSDFGPNFSAGYFCDGNVWTWIADGFDIGKPIAVGEWVALAVDFDAGKAWVRDSTGWDGNPAAGTGNVISFTPGQRLHAATQLQQSTAPDQTTSNFGATAFNYTVPTGFERWLLGSGVATADSGIRESVGTSFVAVAYNPDDPNERAAITLSDYNRVATKSTGANAYECARSVTSYTSGKRYFEARLDAVNLPAELGVFGLIRGPDVNLLTQRLGNTFTSSGLMADGVYRYADVGGIVDTGKPIAVSEWAGFAIDFDTGIAWIRDSTGWYGDPEAATGGLTTISSSGLEEDWYAATQLYSVDDQTTTNFGATLFFYEVPAGFSRWEPLVGGLGVASAVGSSVTATTDADGEADGLGAAAVVGAEMVLLHPDGDTATDGWTDELGGTSDIYQSIDETSVNDLDYVQSPATATMSADLTVRLCEGGATIAEWEHTDISSSFVTATQTLTTPEFEAISDFSNLFIELDDNQGNVYRCAVGDPVPGVTEPVKLSYRYKKQAA